MRITFSCQNTNSEPWLQGFRDVLPGVEINEWVSGASMADYAVVWAPSQSLFDEQLKLRGIFNIGAGVDALMRLRLPPAAQLVRLNDAGMAVQMAEYVCHAVTRHFREFDGYAKDIALQNWTFRKPKLRVDFPVGVMGLGVLGSRVAQALKQFEFPVRGWSRKAQNIDGVTCFSGNDELVTFLRGTRILVCLLPLTPETENILNADNLSCLMPQGYLINVARGAHLVEEDLCSLIDNGVLSGATLDVFRTEPLPKNHFFWEHPKITITPHTSARTLRQDTIAQIAEKILAMERGEFVPGVVVKTRGY